MFNINDTNRDSRILNKIQRQLLTEFPDEILHGAEFGVAYGGGLQQICTIWKGKGFVLGYDTFTEHPKHLASNPNSAEATAMDGWYNQLGKEKLTSAYIHNQLVDAGHSNFNLIEGEINEHISLDHLQLHYAFLDLDLVYSMKSAYNAVKYQMIRGGYLALHDVTPEDHMPDLYKWWKLEDKTNLELVEIGQYLLVYKVK